MDGGILVIDIGNTSTSAGWYRGGRVTGVARLDTAKGHAASVLRLLRRVAAGRPVRGCCIASVVPRATPAWRRAARQLTRGAVREVRHTLDLGVAVHYPDPSRIGPDRLANAAGGAARYGTPLIVADFGTAVTFDCITARGGYVGGVIAPGLPLMFSYLAEKTALLPHIGPGPTRTRIGRSTAEAMRLGARWGYRGMVREILKELTAHPELKGARLVATGGYAAWVVKGLRPRMIVDPRLTLYGLGQIFERNP